MVCPGGLLGKVLWSALGWLLVSMLVGCVAAAGAAWLVAVLWEWVPMGAGVAICGPESCEGVAALVDGVGRLPVASVWACGWWGDIVVGPETWLVVS